MNVNKIIIAVLDVICTFSFFLSSTMYIVLIVLGVMFSGDEVKVGSATLSFNNIIKGAYAVPATLHVSYQDSLSAEILGKKRKSEEGKKLWFNSLKNKNYYLLNDTLLNQLVVRKPYPEKYIKNHPSTRKTENGYVSYMEHLPENYTDDDFLKVKGNDFLATTNIKMKSNKLWYNILLSLRLHILWMTWMFIFFQLGKILTQLRKQINFSFELNERVRIVAWVYLGHQFILFILSCIYSSWYDSVDLITLSTIENFEPYMSVYFKPMLEYNWNTLVIAGFAVLFSHLIKLGLEFKEDSELTI